MKALLLLVAMAVTAGADEAFTAQVGKHAFEILEGADRVETFQILSERDETAGANVVDGCPVVKTGPEKDAAFAKRILEQLRSDDARPNDLKCMIAPHEALRVWKGKEHVDVLISLDCGQVQVSSYPPLAPGPIRAVGAFHKNFAPWFGMCREAFPDDGNLRRLEAARVGPSKKVKEFLGDAIVTTLQDYESVEIFRIKPKEAHSITGPLIDDQELLAKSDAIVPDLDVDLCGTLLDEGTYRFHSAKGCTFEPGVAFRIKSEKHDVVEVLVCFTCNEVMITRVPEGSAKPEPKHEDCDDAREALLRLAKAAFPKDDVIQGLKAK